MRRETIVKKPPAGSDTGWFCVRSVLPESEVCCVGGSGRLDVEKEIDQREAWVKNPSLKFKSACSDHGLPIVRMGQSILFCVEDHFDYYRKTFQWSLEHLVNDGDEVHIVTLLPVNSYSSAMPTNGASTSYLLRAKEAACVVAAKCCSFGKCCFVPWLLLQSG